MSASGIVRNVFSNSFSLVVTAVVAFFLSPFLIKQLGKVDYGIWSLITSLVGYMGLIDFGMRAAVVKYTSEYNSINDRSRLGQLINSSLYLFFYLGILIVGFSIVISFLFPYFFKTSPDRWLEIRFVVFVSGVTFSVQFIMSLFQGYLWGMQRFDIFAIIRILMVLINAGITLLVFLYQPSLLYLAFITAITTTAAASACAYFSAKVLKPIKLSRRLITRESISTLINYGKYNFIISLALRSITYTDTLLIGLILGPGPVTIYSIAKMLIFYAEQLLFSISAVIFPWISELNASGKSIKDSIKISIKLNLIMACPIYIVFIFLGMPFISLWLGSDFSESAIILNVLAISGIAYVLQLPMNAGLKAIARLRFLSLIKISEVLLNLGISLILIWKYEILGVAVGTAMASIIINIFVIPLYSSRVFCIDLGEVLLSILLPFIATIPCILIIKLFPQNFFGSSWLIFISTCGVVEIIYLITAIYVCFSGKERQVVSSKMKLWVNRGRK